LLLPQLDADTQQTQGSNASSTPYTELLQPDVVQLLAAVAAWLASPRIIWKPDFGCAVLPVPGLVSNVSSSAQQPAGRWSAADEDHAVSACLGFDDLALHLVFPDAWEFSMHR
jgi:hypothetical protein